THGRSFWILDDITPLRQLTAAVAKSDVFLFKPAPAFRVRRSTNTDTPIPPDEPTAQNPPDGAIIDYYLGPNASGAVTLEILDAQGKVVRRYSSTDKPALTQEDLARQLIPPYWVRMPRILSAGPGMHRWVWDLHYATPDSPRYDYPISAVPHDTPRNPRGPRALPGTYTVRLAANGHSYSQTLSVKMDPRVKTPALGLAQMFQMQSRLARMMTESTRALAEAHSASEQLQALSSRVSGTAAEAVSAAQKNVSALLGAAAQIGGLYGEIDRADATPTPAQASDLAALEKASSATLAKWTEFKTRDLPALNHQLRAASLPEIQLQSAAREEDGDSEDIE
ncbi:MAG TPA: hypothetical protein VFA13_09410, partial [Candidatus Acidoferrum sp.]|nr:hypothetical protein [Candidatus Acidoferrum sp.]